MSFGNGCWGQGSSLAGVGGGAVTSLLDGPSTWVGSQGETDSSSPPGRARLASLVLGSVKARCLLLAQ